MEKPEWAGILHFQTDWNPLPMISLELTMVKKASGSSRRRKSRSSPACRRVSATMIMVRGSPVYTPVASCWVAVRPSVSVTKRRMGSGR